MENSPNSKKIFKKDTVFKYVKKYFKTFLYISI